MATLAKLRRTSQTGGRIAFMTSSPQPDQTCEALAELGDIEGGLYMRAKQVSVSILTGLALAALLAASAGAAVNYNASKSNTVYFANLTAQGRLALKTLCTKHGGVVVTNAKGQLGCQVGRSPTASTSRTAPPRRPGERVGAHEGLTPPPASERQCSASAAPSA